jgi:hypothetical protein
MIEPFSSAPQSISPAPAQKPHWPSVLAAAGGILVILAFLGGAVLFALSGINALFLPESNDAGEPGLLFSFAAVGIVLALLVLPSVILAARRLSGSSVSGGIFATRLTRKHATWLGLAYILVLLGGLLFSNLPRLEWLAMPILNVLALGLPVILLLWLGTKNLPPFSSQRNWTIFNLGMTLSPFVIMVIELLAIFTGMLLLIVALTFFIPDLPAWVEEFSTMIESAQGTMEFPEDEVIGLLRSPLVVGVILFFTSALVPLVEESIKPIGLWLLAGRDLTPQDGWVLGLLSGAGFALIENLGNLVVGQGWLSLALARGGATALHMFNTAIIGYTFVLSRRQKRWRTVILAFLGTLLLHALWNSVAVIAMVSSLKDLTANPGWPIGYLVILVLASAGTIWGIHRVNEKLTADTKIITESEKQVNDRSDLTTD